MADPPRTSAMLGPYRDNPKPALVYRPRRRDPLRSPIARTLFAPLYAGVSLAAMLGVTLGSLNVSALQRGLFITSSAAGIENVATLSLVATLPLVAVRILSLCRRFSAPRAMKRRYVGRTLAIHGITVALAVAWINGTRPADATLLASASRADGREVYVHRLKWGCGFRVRVADRHWGMAREVTAVGPFECNVPPPLIAWHGDDVTLLTADGKLIGSWPADN